MLKSKYNFKIYTLLALIITSMFALSCDEEEPVSTAPVLLSYGPAGVMHGDTIVFIGENLTKVDTVEFAQSVYVLKENFVSQSNTKVEVVVPETAIAGKVMLHTTEGMLESKTAINFDVIFSIASITEESRPEGNIVITGKFLNWVEEISFHKGQSVTEFVSQSQTEIVVTVPKEAQTGPVSFLGGGTDPLSLELDEDFIVTLPAVTAMAPASLRHAEELTITGTNLDLTKEIIFPDGSIVDDFVSVSASELVVSVPVTSVNGTLTLVAYSGIEVGTSESIAIILPKETELSPSPVAIGEELTITGTDLDLVKSLFFPGVVDPVTDFVSQSATEIKVIVPENTLAGIMKFNTIYDFVVSFTLELTLPGEGPTPLLYTMFGDNYENGWQNWSWNGEVVAPSDEMVFDGTGAIKKNYDGSWDGMSFGGSTVDVSGYTHLVFYIYGSAETDGQKVQLVVSDQWSSPAAVVDIVAGEWTEVTLSVSDLISASGAGNTWSSLIFQGQGTNGVVYFDYVGFR